LNYLVIVAEHGSGYLGPHLRAENYLTVRIIFPNIFKNPVKIVLNMF
jgi:hypothetical protein